MTPTTMPGDISVDITEEDRYSRLRLIPWWNQDRLSESSVMVIGAGALGNEIIKNLALLGIGRVLIVDFDVVEESNLSRSVLFTPDDAGKPKAEAAARAASRINPECDAFALNGDVASDVGLGLFGWADVVMCGLDNREARLAVNRACWKMNTPLVDGATESIQGVARVFTPPQGPCYECTLGEQDLKVMSARDSCGFLAKGAYRLGRTPTTPTTSSVIAGIQTQEAVKMLHGDPKLPALSGKGFFFDGISYECFTIEYCRREDCLSHEVFADIIKTGLASHSATLDDVAREAAGHVGDGVTIDFQCEMVTQLRCSKCGKSEEFFRLMRSVDPAEARCSTCGEIRVPDVIYEYMPGTALGAKTLSDLGFGIMDVVSARKGEKEVQIEISGDLERVFASGQI